MPDIFGVNMAETIAAELAPLLFTVTLVKKVVGRDANDSTKTVTVRMPHSCSGFLDNYNSDYRAGTSELTSDHKVVILGATLPQGVVPSPSDEVLIENTTLTIVPNGVARDPAGATYECRCN